jgi:hypothetical protein
VQKRVFLDLAACRQGPAISPVPVSIVCQFTAENSRDYSRRALTAQHVEDCFGAGGGCASGGFAAAAYRRAWRQLPFKAKRGGM